MGEGPYRVVPAAPHGFAVVLDDHFAELVPRAPTVAIHESQAGATHVSEIANDAFAYGAQFARAAARGTISQLEAELSRARAALEAKLEDES